jgi:hypothetical protein
MRIPIASANKYFCPFEIAMALLFIDPVSYETPGEGDNAPISCSIYLALTSRERQAPCENPMMKICSLGIVLDVSSINLCSSL